MKSKDILYSKGNNDECYTPGYAVKPILKYIPEHSLVRCPFDKEKSEFVKQIRDAGFGVHASHIDNGQDFFKYKPSYYDVIISNPPFTNKRKFFERALELGKPFALIMTNTWLNDAAPKQLFKDKDLQMLMFDKRIHYIKPDGTTDKKTTFSSSYYCYNFLPKQIIMEELDNK